VSCTGQYGGVGVWCTVSIVPAVCVCASTVAIQSQPYLLTSAVQSTFSQELDQHILTSYVHMENRHVGTKNYCSL